MARDDSRLQTKRTGPHNERPRQAVGGLEDDAARDRKKRQRRMIAQNAAQREDAAAPMQQEQPRAEIVLPERPAEIAQPERPYDAPPPAEHPAEPVQTVTASAPPSPAEPTAAPERPATESVRPVMADSAPLVEGEEQGAADAPSPDSRGLRFEHEARPEPTSKLRLDVDSPLRERRGSAASPKAEKRTRPDAASRPSVARDEVDSPSVEVPDQGLRFEHEARPEPTSKLRLDADSPLKHEPDSPLQERPASDAPAPAKPSAPAANVPLIAPVTPPTERNGQPEPPVETGKLQPDHTRLELQKESPLHFEGPEQAAPTEAPAAPVKANQPKEAPKRPKRRSNLRFEESSQLTTAAPSTGRGRPGLRFEGVDKPAPPAKLRHTAAKPGTAGPVPPKAMASKPQRSMLAAAPALPLKAAALGAHREISECEDDNVGIESAHRLEKAAESGAKLMERSSRSRKLKPSRQTEMTDRRLNLHQQKAVREAPGAGSNPLSRWQQSQAIKRQYAANVRGARAAGSAAAATKAKTAEKSAKAAKKAAEEAAKDTGAAVAFIWRHKTGFLIVGVAALVLTFLLNALSSCSVLVEGGVSLLGNSTFANADADMLGAEAAYAGMEAELQSYLDGYEDSHDYDEYHYELDGIGHDPYVLISLLSALHPGQWTLADVGDTLQSLFDQQCILTETVTEETRYDEDNEPYTYYICTVKLENTDLSRLTATMLDEDGLHLYATYMATRGNRPDLFPSSEYPNASTREDYLHYDVPPEALEDETFAAMLAEAEKYLGYPYVWGGASPSTSFDCSGFVSWVINHSGWDVGRLTAQGLFNICTPVTAANARPGDLVLFKGTYNTTEVSHVGIYVGNHMMIHCGDPISYADLDNSYWQQHLYCYGRLP